MNQLKRMDVPKHHKNKVVEKYLQIEKEMWVNEKYTVFVNRGIETPMQFGNTRVTVCWLSIKRNDNQALPDWRDFQWIKNQLVGEENEGCELFPAESRLVDGANQYHLWVFEQTEMKFPFGFPTRFVKEGQIFGETQRDFPEGRKPKDLKESEQKAKEAMKEFMQKK